MERGILERKIALTALYDVYRGLLTDKQSEVLRRYCDLDESISEIADYLCVSRQAVHETLRKLERVLERLEANLGFAGRIASYESTLSAIRQIVESEAVPEAERAAILALLEHYDI